MKKTIIAIALSIPFLVHAQLNPCMMSAIDSDGLSHHQRELAVTTSPDLREQLQKLIALDQDSLAKYEPLCKAAKDEQERLKSLPGVRIGMTARDVLEKTSWGKPDSVNRTTTRHGTSEQWVYEGPSYLYFDNGKLTGIQN